MPEQAPWLVAGRYQVGEVVGRGGYGMVCRGVDQKTGKPVALKMLTPDAGRDPDVVERMLREQQALVALTGTCAVTAIDLCRLDSGAPCLVMEWLEGHDLEEKLSDWESNGVRGSHEQLLSVVKPLSETLERAHAIGIVHRDIKPANIFVTTGKSPGVKLLDFGLSRMKSAAPLTEVGMVMGSPSYIAPETWRGQSATVDGRADLYSLAVIVFRWLTGKLPFDAQDLMGKMVAVTTGQRPSAHSLRPELAKSVDAWLVRALAIEPAERFQSGRDFHATLAAVLTGERLPEVGRGGPGALLAAKTAQGKVALTSAFKSAASLLKRFTTPLLPTPKPSAAPVAPSVPEPHDDSEPISRKSIWLDSEELEEASRPAAAPVPERRSPSKPPPVPVRASKTKPDLKSEPKAEAPSKSKKSSDKPKKKHKGRGKKRKARKA